MITLHDIAALRADLAEHLGVSPCPYSERLAALVGGALHLKLENQRVTGSFKERGAFAKLSRLSDDERRRGVITASAGNHAQAVAYHARRLGLSATVVMPEQTPLIKVLSTRELGASVVLFGAYFDEAYDEALRRADETGAVFVSPFDDDEVIRGQGTIGLELLDQVPDLRQVVVPVGGGGLISGIATAIKETRPEVRVVGVETASYPSMRAGLAADAPTAVPGAATLADGIAVKRVSERTLGYVKRYVDELVTVSEESIARAILLLLERQRTLAEGAAAATLAALLEGVVGPLSPTVLIISGGNIDISRLDDIIVRGLAADGRRIRLKVVMPDVPGQLHRLTGVIAARSVNVLDVLHDREFGSAGLGKTMSTLTLETRGEEQVADLLAALSEAGFEHVERVPAATQPPGAAPLPGY